MSSLFDLEGCTRWDKGKEGGTPKLPVQDPPDLDLGLETLEGGEGGVLGRC